MEFEGDLIDLRKILYFMLNTVTALHFYIQLDSMELGGL